MIERLYLGIDGGGTNTRARLTDEAGRILGEGRAGSSNLTLGLDVALPAIEGASEEALRAAGLTRADAHRVDAGLGLAGANVPQQADEVRDALAARFRRVEIGSDALVACLGAHGGADGAILILGTGSQGLMLANGAVTAIGGWGFVLSDDASGARLGLAALRAAILSADGLAPSTPLTRALLQRFSDRPAEAVLWARTAMPRDYAAFTPLVFETAAAGDRMAGEILRHAATQVDALVGRLAELGAARITLIGGLAEPYEPHLSAATSARLVAPLGDAMDGALRLVAPAARPAVTSTRRTA